MKKILLIYLLLLTLLCSCKTKNKQKFEDSLIDKTFIINKQTINYKSSNIKIDEKIEKEIKETVDANNIITNILTTYNKDYLNYVIEYTNSKNNYKKSFTYDLSSFDLVDYDYSKLSKIINDNYSTNYNLTTDDRGFICIYFKDSKLNVELSSYLTNDDEVVYEIDFSKDLITSYTSSNKIDKKIALTFDDGPSQKTKEIIDLLEHLNVKATFFILGENVKYYKNELKYIDEHHHEIANHSYNHPNFKRITLEEGLNQINKTQKIINDVTGKFPRIFRFPYGNVNKDVLNNINLSAILWNIDSLDWKSYKTTNIVNNVLKEVTNNSIILFHDFKYYNKEAITIVILTLKNEGYEFVTVSELFDFTSPDKMIHSKVLYNN